MADPHACLHCKLRTVTTCTINGVDIREQAACPKHLWDGCPHGLGTLLQSGIDLATFGAGKIIASTLASVFLNKATCRCDERAKCLNELCPDVRALGAMGWAEVGLKMWGCLGNSES